MRSFRLFFLIASVGTVAAGVFVGCGGDDTIVSSGDAGKDGSTVDGSTTPDGSSFVDSGGGVDSGTDTGVPVDAGPPPTIQDFVSHLEQTYCTRIAACCLAADAGAISNTKCLAAAHPDGILGSSTGIIQLIDEAADSGAPGHLANLVVDSQTAKNCYQAISLMPCSLGTTLEAQIISNCFNAVQGKLATGQACETSVECKQPAYCKYKDAGATGTCQPLEAIGAGCAMVTGTGYDQGARGQEACSSRSSGVPAAYCDNEFLDYTLKDPTTWVCAAANGDGGICAYNAACKTNICDPNSGTCTATLDLASNCSTLK